MNYYPHMIFYYIISLMFPTTHQESFFQTRSHEDRIQYLNLRNNNIIRSKIDGELQLQKYGYLNCSIRPKRSISSFLMISQVIAEEGETFINNNELKACSNEIIRQAILKYQKAYKLPETGCFDETTKAKMSEARCGNRDDEQPSFPLNETEENDVLLASSQEVNQQKREIIRKARDISTLSLREIIFNGKEKIKTNTFPERIEFTNSRQTWLENHMEKIQNGEYERHLRERRDEILARRRKKRSLPLFCEDSPEAFAQAVITWRLLSTGYSTQMTVRMQRAVMALAFRMWGEVIPVVFVEDLDSDINDIDIKIAFGKEQHLNCQNSFDRYGGQISHAVRSSTGAEIHFDDDELFTIGGSEHGTNILKVTVHEIGHVLGLIHVTRPYSIMYAIYQDIIPNSDFELGWEDRKEVQKIYGVCQGKFDTIFDWIRERPDGQLIYNTYLFRENRYWLYENRYNRTRYGDPLLISPEWKGLPNNLDGITHIWTETRNDYYFFKDDQYWKYDSENDHVMDGYPRNISSDFRAKAGSNSPNIPSNIDTVMLDVRDNNLYFFKDNLIYGYDVAAGEEGCCLPGYPKLISQDFPGTNGNDPLPGNLDAAYFSFTDKTMYFFKGENFWENKAFDVRDRHRINLVGPPLKISQKWYDVCDVEL